MICTEYMAIHGTIAKRKLGSLNETRGVRVRRLGGCNLQILYKYSVPCDAINMNDYLLVKANLPQY